MAKILFSPIGITDPIAGQRDGAMLHIIRNYRPDKVYLYLSAEICEYEDRDHRYSYCLERMREHLGYDFETVWIRKETLKNVHIFDFFLEEFRNILTEIHNEEDDFLVNVSSGTPAMKSALQILATLFDKPLVPIQVSTPAESSNDHKDSKTDYEVEIQWECDLDNVEGYTNRCMVSPVLNMSVEIKKNIIRNHIHAYDYVAALRVASPIADFLNGDVLHLLKAGAARLKLDRSAGKIASDAASYDMFPVKGSDKIAIFEYIMVMDIKLRKEEYADFLRSISPVFFALMEKIIKDSPQINIDDYTFVIESVQNTKIRKWDSSKLASSTLLQSAGINYDRDTVVASRDYVRLINCMSVSTAVKDLVNAIRTVEERIRNTAAHSITYITSTVIQNQTGQTPEQILKKLRNLSGQVGIPLNETNLRTYEQLNERIEEVLRC
ncbi:MAG: hypothetical protein IJH77_04345 [Mogibacterium sp.]|nr:hypothetical protein [Mogibacterium sp.]